MEKTVSWFKPLLALIFQEFYFVQVTYGTMSKWSIYINISRSNYHNDIWDSLFQL